MEKFRNNLNPRRLIRHDENTVTYTQIFGFILIVTGVIAIIIASLCNSSSSFIAVSFFIIMLGVAFAFPTLLEGNDGLSTMRIVVFMMINVICLLLLKIGWSKGIKSLADIGLDQWWMGVIAFVFGAKATQAYFESKLAVPAPIKTVQEVENINYYELAEACLAQNKSKIESLQGVIKPPFVSFSSNPDIKSPVIKIKSSLKDGGVYPSSYHFTKDGKEFSIGVEVIYGFTKPKIQLNSGDSICNTNHAQNPGTICCAVKKDDKNYLLTCCHVLTGGSIFIEEPTNKGWFLNPKTDDTKSEDENFKAIGTWCFGLIDEEFDVALVETSNDLSSFLKPSDKIAFDNSLNGQEIFVNGKLNKITGYIAGQISDPTEFEYNGDNHKLKNLILISANKYDNPTCATEGGDSGSLVYFLSNTTALGMVVGANEHYTYAIPMNRILERTQTQLV